MKMIDDPIVEEIRQNRKELFQKEFGGSIKKMGEAIRRYQQEHPEKIVNVHKNNRMKQAS
jgi:hypothetical protein